MSTSIVDRIARAVLYEGYVLYPYRRSSIRNQHRWNFGVLYPEAWVTDHPGSDRSWFEMQIPLVADENAAIAATVRFLHVRGDAEEAIERSFTIDPASVQMLLAEPARHKIDFEPIEALIELRVVPASGRGFVLSARVSNHSALRPSNRAEALERSLVSAHVVAMITNGSFISVTDPPEDFAAAAAACQNAGVWPVLVGEPGDRSTVLGSQIILSDYPQVAPESAGDLCDGTEIDEILTLRVMTLTDAEKAEVRDTSEQSRRILAQAESFSGDDLLRLHGKFREARQETAWSAWDSETEPAQVETATVAGVVVKPGDRVRLRPGRRADAIDMLVDGKIAIVESIERDFENRLHLAVVLEDDPGRDLGLIRQSGHRFFFGADEVELVGQ